MRSIDLARRVHEKVTRLTAENKRLLEENANLLHAEAQVAEQLELLVDSPEKLDINIRFNNQASTQLAHLQRAMDAARVEKPGKPAFVAKTTKRCGWPGCDAMFLPAAPAAAYCHAHAGLRKKQRAEESVELEVVGSGRTASRSSGGGSSLGKEQMAGH
jgi:hypothetical protein